VLAARRWSASLPGVPPDVRPPVRPVTGQDPPTCRFRNGRTAARRHGLTALPPGKFGLRVPRADGRVVIGTPPQGVAFKKRVKRRWWYEKMLETPPR